MELSKSLETNMVTRAVMDYEPPAGFCKSWVQLNLTNLHNIQCSFFATLFLHSMWLKLNNFDLILIDFNTEFQNQDKKPTV